MGATARADRLDFQYSTDATAVTSGTWTDVNALDFASPNTAAVGATDGNAAANRTALTGTINGLTLAPAPRCGSAGATSTSPAPTTDWQSTTSR